MRKAYIKLLSTQQSKTSREQNNVHFHGTLSQAWEKNVHWTPSHGWLNYKTDEGLQSSPSTGATCYKYLFAVLIARDQLHLMTIRFDYLVQFVLNALGCESSRSCYSPCNSCYLLPHS